MRPGAPRSRRASRVPGVPRIARKADGRRIFTLAFKRRQIARVRRGEVTLAELGRKLGIARSLLQRWKRLIPEQGSPPVRPQPGVNGIGTEHYIRELERLVGRQAAELELLRAELELYRRRQRPPASPAR